MHPKQRTEMIIGWLVSNLRKWMFANQKNVFREEKRT